ncbi:mitogen-activated protein kinase kinase kinase 17-like [Aristolochia californica]|uniref:mitogen-activated protein kinase kinase kinase 17-like n=1 Tax=Aristolochia californica TaxID=171875 RepID=UPI0035D9507E
MAVKGIKSQPPKQWVKGNVVGSGSFGIVSLAMNKCNGELFVVKSAPSGNAMQCLEKEASILENLNSPHVVRCLGHALSEEANGVKNFNIFMEYMAGGSLSDVSDKFGGILDESVIRLYTREILQGVAYLHRSGIVHSDLKCKNVLLGSSGNVKLADFGSARKLKSPGGDCSNEKSCQTLSGSPLWMAPEVLRKERPDFAADIWSLGCTVIEMASGRPPWADQVFDPMAAIFKIACGKDTPAFPADLSEEGLDFLRKCLQRDPKSRWTCEQLLTHPFVSKKSSGTCFAEDPEDSFSPTSILDVNDWDSEMSDGSESPDGTEFLTRTPFSMPPRKLQHRLSDLPESDNWIDVRSD